MQGITSLQLLNDDEGRWGNQLFRLATLIGYSKKNNCQFHVPVDWKYKAFFNDVSKFNVSAADLKYNLTHQYHENGFHYQEIPGMPDNVGLLEIVGYFQSYKYFDNAKAEVMDFFTFNSDIVSRVKSTYFQEPKVRLSAHMRHGDFYDRSRNKGHKGNEYYHPVMTLEYYKRCIQHIQNSTSIDELLIFTDHPDTRSFIQDQFNEFNINTIYVDYKTEFIYDFVAQMLCDHAIIPNSSFSWWSAYLNKNPNKIIYCPQSSDWFGPGYSGFNMDDLLPESWIKINQ